MAQVYVLVPESDWNVLASGCALRHAPEQEMCALSLKPVTLSRKKHHRPQVLHIPKNYSHTSNLDRQTLHSLLQFLFKCDLICVTHSGVQYCWNAILEDMASSNHLVRWSLKRAKCTVCLSSNLFRGNLAFTRHTQVGGKDFSENRTMVFGFNHNLWTDVKLNGCH